MKTILAPALALSLALAGAAALAQPAADPSAPANPAIHGSGDSNGAPLAQGHNSFTKSQAADRIQKAGYTDVTDLTLDAQGLWQATAMRDGQTVHVALDYKGDVATQ
jgi:hypothetical protein